MSYHWHFFFCIHVACMKFWCESVYNTKPQGRVDLDQWAHLFTLSHRGRLLLEHAAPASVSGRRGSETPYAPHVALPYAPLFASLPKYKRIYFFYTDSSIFFTEVSVFSREHSVESKTDWKMAYCWNITCVIVTKYRRGREEDGIDNVETRVACASQSTNGKLISFFLWGKASRSRVWQRRRA